MAVSTELLSCLNLGIPYSKSSSTILIIPSEGAGHSLSLFSKVVSLFVSLSTLDNISGTTLQSLFIIIY